MQVVGSAQQGVQQQHLMAQAGQQPSQGTQQQQTQQAQQQEHQQCHQRQESGLQ
jgi:hypothetical protein